MSLHVSAEGVHAYTCMLAGSVLHVFYTSRVCLLLQELSRVSAEASQMRMAVEEARAAAEDGRRARAALQVDCRSLG
jgi:hypothetical protein